MHRNCGLPAMREGWSLPKITFGNERKKNKAEASGHTAYQSH